MATKLDMRYNVLLVRGEHSLTASLTRNICKNSDFYLMYKDLRGDKRRESRKFLRFGVASCRKMDESEVRCGGIRVNVA